MERKIRLIAKKDIDAALTDSTREYLVGKLARPQKLVHIDDDQIEIGITAYNNFSYEKPHYHTQANEYQYLMSGMTEYLDVETGEVYQFKKGDFYKTPPGVRYAQKSKPGTTIFFIKTPPGNDKQELELTDKVAEWLQSQMKITRSDFTNDPSAPAANSIKPAAAVAIVNDQNEILLLQRRDNGKWTMPGGTMDFGEDLKTCAIREVQEETGYKVEVTDIIGTYSNPKTVIAYSDGEVRQEFAILYRGTITNGHFEMDSESTAYKWIKLEQATQLPMAESQKQRMEDVILYFEQGVWALK
ncbi:NUDIX domain-containing protein [Bacillus sp. T3]|uniref:NUDIX domain-containing protein n=1 Tax=Bacillus sp. T3 TaxID=467262 RepID=UPI0029817638|nr:NUDIX domain-containing protein [Bacillus sp. T3]